MSNCAEDAMTGRRGLDFCPMHESNTQAIGKNSGQMSLLIGILGVGIAMLVSVAGTAYYKQQESIEVIASSVHSIDNTMVAYVASHTSESSDGFRRIYVLEKKYEGLDMRLDALERK